MITCNRCGHMNPDGTRNCQRCGAPLSSSVDNRYSPQVGAQGQQRQQGPQAQPPGLPSWLESLRAGERPAKNPSSFDAADLIEEGTLPSWMRPERGETPGGSASAQHGDLRSSTFPGPNTDEGGRNINAHSLIDEQSMPAWMQDASGKSGQINGLGPNNITGSSLVQSDAVPEWMKNIAPLQPSSSPPAQPVQKDQPPRQRKPEDPSPFTGPMKPLAHGFSAGELIDQQSLPTWMAQPNAQPGAPGVPTPTHEQGGQRGQAGFSASSLLDANAVPSWLQESGQGKKVNPAAPSQAERPSGSFQSQQPQQTWQPGSAAPSRGPAANMPAGGGLSASSFLDRDSLPGWLAGTADQSQAADPRQAATGNLRPGVFGEQQRVENVRVPSRPRSEIHSSQDSEVAANVFASMLGVASAPNYPMQPPNAQTPQPGQPGAHMPQPQSASQANPFAMPQNAPYGAPQASSTSLNNQQGMSQNAPYGAPQPLAPGTSGTSLGVPQGMPQNAPYGTGQGIQQGGVQPGIGLGQPSQPMQRYPQSGQSNIYPPQGNVPNNYYTMGSPSAGMPPGMSNTPSLQQMPNSEPRSDAKPAKRGLFNAIREWLSPSR